MSKTLETFVTEVESSSGLSQPLYADEVMLISREVNENYVALAEKGAEAIIASQSAQARIAELTAEVVRIRGLVKEAYEEGVSDTDAAEEGRWDESHARNALKEGK